MFFIFYYSEILLEVYLSLIQSFFRPISLISTVSKLLTKIVGARISNAVESSSIVNDSQNGFRKKRSCSDNIFILNTIVESAQKRKKPIHLLFVDLAEAYDRTNREILLYRLNQLGFPMEFLDFLTSYYSGDSIQCAPHFVPISNVFID